MIAWVNAGLAWQPLFWLWAWPGGLVMVAEVTILLMAAQSIRPLMSNAMPPIWKSSACDWACRAPRCAGQARTELKQDRPRYQAVLSRQTCALNLGI